MQQERDRVAEEKKERTTGKIEGQLQQEQMGKILEGKVTTDHEGKMLRRNAENGDDLPQVLLDKIYRRVVTKPREKMNWRDVFALAMAKKVRYYLTKGREEALLKDTGKLKMVNQRTDIVMGKYLLNVEERYKKIQ